MKQPHTRLLILLGLVLTLAGCGSSTADSGQATPAKETISIPQEEPAITGMVKAIVGNEVTIYKMAAPQGRPETPASDQQTSATASTQDKAKTGSKTEDAGRQTANTNSPPAANGAEDTDSSPADGTKTPPSGETETFIIPAGAKIVAMNGGENTTAALTDIKENQMIRVWKTNETISLVQVMGGQSERKNTNEQNNSTMQGPPGGMPMGGPGGSSGSGITRGLNGSR